MKELAYLTFGIRERHLGPIAPFLVLIAEV